MTVPDTAPRRWVAVFDLDGTLTWHDTLLLFLISFLRRHPRRWFGLWRLPFALVGFMARNGDRGVLKSQLIQMAMAGSARSVIDDCAEFAERFLAAHGPATILATSR